MNEEMNDTIRTCHVCGSVVGATSPCDICTEAFARRKDVAGMSVPERAVEINRWLDEPLEISPSLVHERIEELMGRAVWTTEFADVHALCNELRSHEQATMTDIIAKIPKDKVLFVAVKGEDDEHMLKG